MIANEIGIAIAAISDAAAALQEQQDDERDQDQRLHDLPLEAAVGGAHERRLVEDRLDLEAGRQVLQVAHGLLDRVDDLERVAARDAQHVQVDGVVAVDGDRLRLGRAAVLDASRRP